jgi:hypothetical protein
MGCGASSASAPPGAATIEARPSRATAAAPPPPPLPPGCAIAQWRGRSGGCVARVRAALQSIAQHNAAVNACIEVLSEEALAAAQEADARLAGGARVRCAATPPSTTPAFASSAQGYARAHLRRA